MNTQNTSDQKTSLPLGIPIVCQFEYLRNCLVCMPVVIKIQDEKYFMKNPINPPEEWKMPVIMRCARFPEEYPIKLYESPNSDTEAFWESKVLAKVTHSENAEIFQIKKPLESSPISQRGNKRFFCYTPVRIFPENSSSSYKATCLDISLSGVGLKTHGTLDLMQGQKLKVVFEKPCDNFPNLAGKIVRLEFNYEENSAMLGLLLDVSHQNKALQIINQISKENTVDGLNLSSPITSHSNPTLPNSLF